PARLRPRSRRRVNRRWVVAALLALCVIGWWYSPVSPRVPEPPAPVVGATAGCPMPARATAGGAPLQSTVPRSLPAFALEVATLQPLAGFSVDARVLSREDYSLGREADLSPTDLALGWQEMADDAVLSRLDISQSGRWYRYRWQGEPPLPRARIARSSANMHMIPFDAHVALSCARCAPATACASMTGWSKPPPPTAGAGAARSRERTPATAPANWSTCARSRSAASFESGLRHHRPTHRRLVLLPHLLLPLPRRQLLLRGRLPVAGAGFHRALHRAGHVHVHALLPFAGHVRGVHGECPPSVTTEHHVRDR